MLNLSGLGPPALGEVNGPGLGYPAAGWRGIHHGGSLLGPVLLSRLSRRSVRAIWLLLRKRGQRAG